MFFAGDLYAGTGVVVDPEHPPRVGDSLEQTARDTAWQTVRGVLLQGFRTLLSGASPGSTPRFAASLTSSSKIMGCVAHDPDYYAQTNSDDLILDKASLRGSKRHFRPRIVVYDHGGHLGQLGETRANRRHARRCWPDDGTETPMRAALLVVAA